MSSFHKHTDNSLTLVAVVVVRQDLFGLNLVLHRLYEKAWVVCSDYVLLSSRDNLA